MKNATVTVLGAGIFGLWQAFELARRGWRVTLIDIAGVAGAGGASRFAGAMLAPYCEGEAAEPIVEQLGVQGLSEWLAALPGVVQRGSLVVAAARDRTELSRFARQTRAHRTLDQVALAALEPSLADRFASALYYEAEAHVAPRAARAYLLAALGDLGVDVRLDADLAAANALVSSLGVHVIDCRGLAARDRLSGLRGVRGEMAVVRAPDVRLSRPVRLLHPRFPLYVVPWEVDTYMIGATLIEREDGGPVTLRSALDLLGTAYAVHPAFGEAEVIELSAGVRPAFADNVPKVVVTAERIHVNGAYRHGYLLAPVLARAAADYLETGARLAGIVIDGGGLSIRP